MMLTSIKKYAMYLLRFIARKNNGLLIKIQIERELYQKKKYPL